MKRHHPLALPALILAAVFGGLASIFGKLALRQFSPFFIITLRFGLASLLLVPALIASKNFKIKKKDYFLILLIGLLGAINVFSFIIGLQYTTAIMSQVMYLLVPLFVLILTKIFFQEKAHYYQALGIFLGFLGAGLLLTRSFLDQKNQLVQSLGSFRGNLILLIGVFSWSLYLIFSKKASHKYSALALTTYTSLFIFPFSLIFIIKNINQHRAALMTASMTSLIGVLGLVFLNSIGMLFLYQWGNKHSSPFIAASVIYLGPLTAAVVAIPLFGERLSSALLISTGLISLSIYFATIYPLLKNKKKSVT